MEMKFSALRNMKRKKAWRSKGN